MAPWTGKLIQSNLDKLTPNNIDEVAAKLVNIIDTRTQIQKLALLVAQRVQRAYTNTFHLPFDIKRRQVADSLVASLLRCFANMRKGVKGVPSREGLSGTSLFKADLLGAGLYEKTGIAPVITSLYNICQISCEEVKTIIFACLDKKYANDADKVGEVILLLEYTLKDIDRQDEGAMNNIMDLVKEHLNNVSGLASERKTCGERLIPSLNDRYQELVQKRKEGWKESPYSTSVNPSTMTAATTSVAKEIKPIPATSTASDLADDSPVTPINAKDAAQQSLWLANFAPSEVDPSKMPSPTRKETHQSNTSLSSEAMKPLKRCPSCSRLPIPDDTDAQIAYGQAIGDPEFLNKMSLYTGSSAIVVEKVNPTLTFDDEDDSLTMHLDVQAGSPIKVKFNADTRLGDAKRIAKLFSASITSKSLQGEQSLDSFSSSTNLASSPPIQFLPNGRISTKLKSSNGDDISVLYPSNLSLLQARNIGESFASAMESYTR